MLRVPPAVLPPHALQRDHHPPRPAVVPVLVQVDSLPRAEGEAAAPDGQQEAGAHEGALHVRRHVVVALVQVAVLRALGYQAVQGVGQVQGHVGASVLVDGQARRGVLRARGRMGREGAGRGRKVEIGVGQQLENYG